MKDIRLSDASRLDSEVERRPKRPVDLPSAAHLASILTALLTLALVVLTVWMIVKLS